MRSFELIRDEHKNFRGWVSEMFDKLPGRFRPAVDRRYSEKYQGGSFHDANVLLRETVEALQNGAFSLSKSNSEINDFCKARAGECFRVAMRYMEPMAALQAMEAVAQRYGIEPPDAGNVTETGRRARLLCEKWWRRAVRRYVARRVEAVAINLGMVHRYAGLYASDEAVARRAGQRERNKRVLSSIVAVNESAAPGMRNEYTLQELSDLGVSNPKIRRMELMTRLAGFDEYAKAYKHVADFYTITCPSKFHARDSKTGKENRKYNGATPKEAQAYLCATWAKIRAKLHRDGLRVYGFRVCEPHHDGCPHWHILLFMEKRDQEAVRAIIQAYAIKENREELRGDIGPRFKVEEINPAKGSAVAYIAKYIAKNIDGYNVGEDWETPAGKQSQDAADTSARVDAWAATWGIRQFQQIGGAPVTVWRELRRMDAAEQTDIFLKALVTAADAGNWAVFVELMGGATAKRGAFPVQAYRVGGVNLETGEIKYNAYGEIAAPVIKGILYGAEAIETRAGVWVFKRDGEAVTPWSSVNNCTRNFEGVGPERVEPSEVAQACIEIEPGESVADYDRRLFLAIKG